jgi:phosphotransferase system  glucose/maltose/N-acetylglucosamine-specific IIC component
MSMALTAFLTGVTEPVEFTFMFLAPILYVIHGVLTGISMALMTFLGVRLGFTFSAGAFDYIISYRLGTRLGVDTSRLRLLPHLLLPFQLRDSKVQSGNARPR